MNAPTTPLTPATVKLPFKLGLYETSAIHHLEACERNLSNHDTIRTALAAQRDSVQASALATLGYAVIREVWNPMDKLVAADNQAREEAVPVLGDEDRAICKDRPNRTDAHMRLWFESPEVLEADKELLERYAAALAIEPKCVSERHNRDQHGHDDDPVYDYSEIIEAMRQINKEGGLSK